MQWAVLLTAVMAFGEDLSEYQDMMDEAVYNVVKELDWNKDKLLSEWELADQIREVEWYHIQKELEEVRIHNEDILKQLGYPAGLDTDLTLKDVRKIVKAIPEAKEDYENDKDIVTRFKSADSHGDANDRLNEEEFILFMEPEVLLRYHEIDEIGAFQVIDTSGDGMISMDEYIDYLRKAGALEEGHESPDNDDRTYEVTQDGHTQPSQKPNVTENDTRAEANNNKDALGQIPEDMVSEILKEEMGESGMLHDDEEEDEENDIDIEDLRKGVGVMGMGLGMEEEIEKLDSRLVNDTFNEMDVDNDHEISRNEFLTAAGVYWDVDSDGRKWIEELDKDGDKLLSAREILEGTDPEKILDFLAALHYDDGDEYHEDGAELGEEAVFHDEL